MKTLRLAKQLLRPVLDDICTIFDFCRVSDLLYERRERESISTLAWPCRRDPRGFAAFTCIVSVRHIALSRWLVRGSDPTRPLPSAAQGIHFLRDGHFEEWRFSTLEELLELRSRIEHDLREYGMPFIDRFSTLDSIRAAVNKPAGISEQ